MTPRGNLEHVEEDQPTAGPTEEGIGLGSVGIAATGGPTLGTEGMAEDTLSCATGDM